MKIHFFFMFFVIELAQARSAHKVPCPTVLTERDMYYCGTKINSGGNSICVKVGSASEAISQCGALGYKTAWNLSLRQYALGGNIPNGVYICSSAPTKFEICKANNFKWVGSALSGFCSFEKNMSQDGQNCDGKISSSEGGPAVAETGADEARSADVNGENTVSTNEDKKKTSVVDASAAVDLSNPICLEKLRDYVQQCTEKSEIAEKKCNIKNPDTQKIDYLKSASKIVFKIGEVLKAKGVQAGRAENCLSGGLISATSYHAYQLLKEDCAEDQLKCKEACTSADAEYKLIEQKCTKEFSGDNLAQVLQKAEDYKIQYADAWTVTCKKKAKENADVIAALLVDANQAGVDSAKCNCQSLAGGGANFNLLNTANGQSACGLVLGPEACSRNPNLPGCLANFPNQGCAGENAKTRACICASNPNSVQCTGTVGTGVSAVAGPGQSFNGISVSGSNFKPTGGAGVDLGGLDDSTNSAAASTDRSRSQNRADSPFAAASGGAGSGGGSGGSGGSSSEDPNQSAAEEPKSGISGLYSQLKNGLANVMGTSGSGKSAKGKSFRESKKNQIDPNIWSPKGFSESERTAIVGRKNSDLFQMIQTRYGDQFHTFMTIPTPTGSQIENPK